MALPSVEIMIERIMDAFSYEEFLELLLSRDDTADAVADAVRDIVEDDESGEDETE